MPILIYYYYYIFFHHHHTSSYYYFFFSHHHRPDDEQRIDGEEEIATRSSPSSSHDVFESAFHLRQLLWEHFYSSKGSKRHQPFVKNTQDTRNMATLSADASATLGNENNVEEIGDYDISTSFEDTLVPLNVLMRSGTSSTKNGLIMQREHMDALDQGISVSTLSLHEEDNVKC